MLTVLKPMTEEDRLCRRSRAKEFAQALGIDENLAEQVIHNLKYDPEKRLARGLRRGRILRKS